ncbi:hypothetical protein OHA25_36330 [Nonomuraea sp. NBC_00507]|uniref:hypothetical protein n=1 Tax=Nonomuraea sp. NBC_00507 TaxID=2976002 RepID=UPI002E199A06
MDGAPIGTWPSGRYGSLLAFLVTYRHPRPSREALMETFWPGASPEAERTNLQVAIHGVRGAVNQRDTRILFVQTVPALMGLALVLLTR